MSPEPDRRALESRLRRRKRRLERINPLEQPERYRDAFIEVIDLEAALHRPDGSDGRS